MALMKWPSPVQLAALAGAVAVADLGTKHMAITVLSQEPLRLTSFFTLSLGFNSGVSFGFFQTQSPWGFALIVAVTSLLAAAVGYGALHSRHPAERIGFTFISGGALGNIVDRVIDGRVTDFLDFHVGDWHWPAFNLADAAITAGVAILLSALMFETQTQKSGALSSENPRE